MDNHQFGGEDDVVWGQKIRKTIVFMVIDKTKKTII